MSITSWMTVPGFPEYEISESGTIRKINASRHKKAGEEIAPFVRKNGYLQVHLHSNGIRRRFLVHRLVALAFIGDQPSELHEIAHLDGKRCNNHFRNLAWKTHQENELDKIDHGTVVRGERVGTSKLTSIQAAQIKERLAAGEKQIHIAPEYGVHHSTLSLIARKKYWRHI